MKTFNEFMSIINEDVDVATIKKMSEDQFQELLRRSNPSRRNQLNAMRQTSSVRMKDGQTSGGSRVTTSDTRPSSSSTSLTRGGTPITSTTRPSLMKNVRGALSNIKNKIPQPVRRLGNNSWSTLSTLSNVKADYDDRREQGQSQLRSTGGALASGAGWQKGMQLGAQLGSRIPGPKWLTTGAGGILGGVLGAETLSRGYDAVVDATRPTRQAISRATGYDKQVQANRLANQITKRDLSPEELKRQTSTIFNPLELKMQTNVMPTFDATRQAYDTMAAREGRGRAAQQGTYGSRQGSALVGTGGQTTVDTKANTITTNGRTVNLPRTRLLKSGQVGDLAYKDGKPVYLARADVSDRIQDRNLSHKVQRFLGLGRYSQSELQNQRNRERAQANANNLRYSREIRGQSTTPPVNNRSAQAYAASKGKYYSNTTGKTYANYAAALADIQRLKK